jgi:hypothetical protein
VDYHLEAARLTMEQVADSGGQDKVSWEAARKHVEKAAELIEKTGYHRRDREVEELREMLEE